ncbi:hypothetical protein LX32DRAFT_117643 [Colletotrichum zoysiae]|uniref:Uncharacterized protein n=1 Tax=Colletotrichum zoysiae TaxID=1216348 RepID=A0AAD9M649_9PEZI|nr:hypothetical protein LX32DRAFT_117643 [Colletotrichum zoysiae]
MDALASMTSPIPRRRKLRGSVSNPGTPFQSPMVTGSKRGIPPAIAFIQEMIGMRYPTEEAPSWGPSFHSDRVTRPF